MVWDPGTMGLHYLRSEFGQNPSLVWTPGSSVIKCVYLQIHLVVPSTPNSRTIHLSHGNNNGTTSSISSTTTSSSSSANGIPGTRPNSLYILSYVVH